MLYFEVAFWMVKNSYFSTFKGGLVENAFHSVNHSRPKYSSVPHPCSMRSGEKKKENRKEKEEIKEKEKKVKMISVIKQILLAL